MLGFPIGILIIVLIVKNILTIYLKGGSKVGIFILSYLLLAAIFESFLFSINGMEGYLFWLTLVIELKYITWKRAKSEI